MEKKKNKKQKTTIDNEANEKEKEYHIINI